MRLLMIGGTVFLGRAITDAAFARGHVVTHLNRARTAGADARVETIVCDREALPFMDRVDPARTWDAVIDTCGYLPQVVRASSEALRDRVESYAFVSSISVYRSFETAGFDEDAPLQEPPQPLPSALQPELYGALKAGCETVVRGVFGSNALIVRPGLLVGPNDPTDRFTWWPWRIAQGGAFVAPGRYERQVQFVDVRDVAAWMVSMLERRHSGTYQVTGPADLLTMGELIDCCIAVCAPDRAKACWLADDLLLQRDVQPWSEMPLWLPDADSAHRAFMAANIERALARGLTFRSIADTVRDTLQWARSRGEEHRWKAGVSTERERLLLDAAEAARSDRAPAGRAASTS